MGSYFNKGETIKIFDGVTISSAAGSTSAAVKLSQSSGAIGGQLVADGPATVTVKVRNGGLPFIPPVDNFGSSLESVASLAAIGSVALPVVLPAFEEYEFTVSTTSVSDVTVSFYIYLDNKE